MLSFVDAFVQWRKRAAGFSGEGAIIANNGGTIATAETTHEHTCRPRRASRGSSSGKESCIRIPKSLVTNSVVTCLSGIQGRKGYGFIRSPFGDTCCRRVLWTVREKADVEAG